jgi:hypothetical protein
LNLNRNRNGKGFSLNTEATGPKSARGPSCTALAACLGLARAVARELPRAAQRGVAGPGGAPGCARWPARARTLAAAARTVWRHRRLTDDGRYPRTRASRAPASTGALAGQHLGGSDAAERCGDVRWRRYAGGGGGAMMAADEGGELRQWSCATRRALGSRRNKKKESR